MDSESAIRRLSFAEAKHSSAEAMIAMAKHRAELAREAEIDQRSEAQAVEEFTDRTNDEHRVDKTA